MMTSGSRLPIVATRRRAVPELLPEGYRALVDARAPEQIAQELLCLLTDESAQKLHQHFVGRFTAEQHLASLAAAFQSVERSDQSISLQPCLWRR